MTPTTPPVQWRGYKSDKCEARMAIVGDYLVTEASGHLDGPLAAAQVQLCLPIFTRGQSLGAFHLWESTGYDTAYRTGWTDVMKHWGTKYFRDLNVYVPAGITRMGLSVAAALRIGDMVIYKSRQELLARRMEVLGI